MTIQCCTCNKVRRDESWETPQSASDDVVSHTYCPACFAEAMDEVRGEMEANRERAALG